MDVQPTFGVHFSFSCQRLHGGTVTEAFAWRKGEVARASDVDGDGFSDVLVGAPFASGSELTSRTVTRRSIAAPRAD
jgi:hypothetical protein